MEIQHSTMFGLCQGDLWGFLPGWLHSELFLFKFPLKFSISSQPDWQAETVNVTLVCALSWICLIHKCPQSLFLNKKSYVSSCWLKVINYPQKTPPPKVLLGGTLWGGTSWVHQSSVIRRPEVDFLAFTLKVVLIVTTPIHRNIVSTAQALDAVRKDPIIRHQCTENCQTQADKMQFSNNIKYENATRFIIIATNYTNANETIPKEPMHHWCWNFLEGVNSLQGAGTCDYTGYRVTFLTIPPQKWPSTEKPDDTISY